MEPPALIPTLSGVSVLRFFGVSEKPELRALTFSLCEALLPRRTDEMDGAARAALLPFSTFDFFRTIGFRMFDC